jgi:uncharacterized membrane protein
MIDPAKSERPSEIERRTSAEEGSVTPRELDRVVTAKVPKLNQIPESDRIEAIRIIASVFEGPIPSPQILSQYAALDPALVGRIVAMAEAAQAHDQTVQMKVVEAEIDGQRKDHFYRMAGLSCGFLIGIAGLVLCGYAISNGMPHVAIALGALPVGALVWRFISGRPRTVVDEGTKGSPSGAKIPPAKRKA